MPSIVHHHRRERRSWDITKYLNYAIVSAVVLFVVLITTLSGNGNPENTSGTTLKSASYNKKKQQQEPEQFNPVVPQDDDFYIKKRNYDDDFSAESMVLNIENDKSADFKISNAAGDDYVGDDATTTEGGNIAEISKKNNMPQNDRDHPFVEQNCDLERNVNGRVENGTIADWWPSDHSWKTRTPFFLLIGAKKGGTTSLSGWLNRHPMIVPPRTKELLSFLPNRMHDYYDELTNKVLVNDLRADMYERDYNVEQLSSNDAMITFEATPGYLLYSTLSRIPIMCSMPWTKMLVTLREPVDRVFSNYNFLVDARMKKQERMTGMASSNNGNMPKFDVFVQQDMKALKQAGVIGDKATGKKAPEPGSPEERQAWTNYQGMIGRTEAPVGRSLYVLQLQEWFDGLRELGRDPESDILVVRNEDMRSDPDGVYQTILWWLELPSFTPPMGYTSQMVTQYRSPPMSNETRAMLETFYKPYNKRLFRLLGWDNDVWQKKTEKELEKEQEAVEDEELEEIEEQVREQNMDASELAHIYDPPDYDEGRGTNFTNKWCVLDRVSWYPPPNKIWQLRAPYFMLPGAKKSGTTSLASYLIQHPSVQPARQKELQFFLNKNFRSGYVTDERKTMVKEARDHLYSMEFHSQALKRNNSLISMDATPGYLFFSAMLPQRILCVTPWIKLVIILRNPIDRAYSNWAFALRRNNIALDRGPSFERYIQQDMNTLETSGFTTAASPEEEAAIWPDYLRMAREGPIGRSMYEIQLRQWFQAIRDVGRDPKTQVYIVRSEDLKKDIQGEMRKVYKFLGLEDVPVQREEKKVVTHYSAPMANETRANLEKFFAPYNRRLYDLLLDHGFGKDWDGFWDPKTKVAAAAATVQIQLGNNATSSTTEEVNNSTRY